MKPNSLKFIIQEKNVTWFAWWTVCRDFTTSKILKKYLGQPYKNQVIVFENGDGNWATDLESWFEYGEKLVYKITSGKFPLQKLVAEHELYAKRIIRLCNEILKINISTVPANSAVNLFTEVIKNYLQLNEAGFVPVVSDLEHGIFTAKLTEILSHKTSNPEDLNKYLNLLMTSEIPTAPFQEMTDLFKLAIKFSDNHKLARCDELQSHINKYNWINFGYKGPAWNKKNFLNRITRLRKEHYNLKSALSEHLNSLRLLEKDRKKAEIKLKLTAQEKSLFKTARTFSYLKAMRVDVRHYFCYTMYECFKQLSKKHSLPLTWFEYANEDEISSLLRGKFKNPEKIIQRSKFYCEIWIGKKVTRLNEVQTNKYTKRYVIKEVLKNVDEIKGQPAFLGKVTGAAKIIAGPKDIGKIKTGNILIAVYTDPNLLPAMEKAAAFVTDQGGITSHAAIVAREMKKPCIIGTKIATKVFKDGDIMEVDANKGIIRKIK